MKYEEKRNNDDKKTNSYVKSTDNENKRSFQKDIDAERHPEEQNIKPNEYPKKNEKRNDHYSRENL